MARFPALWPGPKAWAVVLLAGALAACAGAPEPVRKAPVAAPVETPAAPAPDRNAAAPETAAAPVAPPVPGAATADDTGFAADARRKPVMASREMVVTANPLASEAGLAILKRGGNAVDAAIAVQAMLTLVEPQSSGIGGGGFLMYFDGKSGEIAAYEGREAAALATTENDFVDAAGRALSEERYRVGGLSVAVPGALRMLEMAHKRHGKLAWRQLFQPAIAAARKGFAVSPRLHRSIARDRYLTAARAARAYLFDAEGRPRAVGSLLRNPALADTLDQVARRGADALHRGPIARDIAAAVAGDKARPGKVTIADIARYDAKKRRHLCGPYRVWLVCGFGPPTAGGVTTLMTLAMLERFDLAKLQPNSPEAVHLFAEASRLAEADRLRYVADPDAEAVPLAGLLDPRYLARRSALISETQALAEVAPGDVPGAKKAAGASPPAADSEAPSTTHFNIVDKDGNAVAMTSSVGDAFGSRLFVRGFFLNNHATDFTAEPRAADGRPEVNRPGPNKRPRSAQSPTFVFDGSGRLILAVGSPGGPRIIAFVTKTLIAVLDWKMDIQAAISLPNVAVGRNAVVLERGTALEGLQDRLRAMGHNVRPGGLASGLQGIAIQDGVLWGGADSRREGVALGD